MGFLSPWFLAGVAAIGVPLWLIVTWLTVSGAIGSLNWSSTTALVGTLPSVFTGFTATTLGAALIGAGFVAVVIQRDLPNFSLTAIAFRTHPDAEQMAIWRARLLPAADRPTVLYTRNA